MPTPLGHSLSGALIYVLFAKTGFVRKEWKWFLFAAVAATIPDWDFIPGLLNGNANHFHRGISHSIGGTFLFAVVCWLAFKPKCAFPPLKLFVFLFVLYGSHLILDLFAMDPAPPYGAKYLWPFSTAHFRSPVEILPYAERGPWEEVLCLRNVCVFFAELFIFGIPLYYFARKFSLTRTNSGGENNV